MTFTYSGDPQTSDLDECRFWIQDTDEQRPLLSDEDLSYLLNAWMPDYGSVLYVAAMACDVISSRYAHEVGVGADGVSVNVGELQDKYLKLGVRLRELYKASVVGGAVDFKDLLSDFSWDYTIPAFTFGIGLLDNTEAGRQDYGGMLGSAQRRYIEPTGPDIEGGGPG